jgi:hypothetical protein
VITNKNSTGYFSGDLRASIIFDRLAMGQFYLVN